MNYIKLDYDKAIQLQNAGQITLIDVSYNQLKPVNNEYGQLWKDNYDELLHKVPHISPDKVIDFFNAKYVTEYLETIPHGECFQYTWRYLYGIENKSVKDKLNNDIEYVYILTNPGYPNLVKVGITTKDVNARVTAINATATVYEWVVKYAIPVSKGSAHKIEQQVHTALAQYRVDSDQGNSREFFEIDPLTALDVVTKTGALHMVGNVIVY
jgi:hypothetical protein